MAWQPSTLADDRGLCLGTVRQQQPSGEGLTQLPQQPSTPDETEHLTLEERIVDLEQGAVRGSGQISDLAMRIVNSEQQVIALFEFARQLRELMMQPLNAVLRLMPQQ